MMACGSVVLRAGGGAEHRRRRSWFRPPLVVPDRRLRLVHIRPFSSVMPGFTRHPASFSTRGEAGPGLSETSAKVPQPLPKTVMPDLFRHPPGSDVDCSRPWRGRPRNKSGVTGRRGSTDTECRFRARRDLRESLGKASSSGITMAFAAVSPVQGDYAVRRERIRLRLDAAASGRRHADRPGATSAAASRRAGPYICPPGRHSSSRTARCLRGTGTGTRPRWRRSWRGGGWCWKIPA